jgi:ketosteroid isomerase-like protein
MKEKVDMQCNYDIVQDHYTASARQDIAAMFAHVSETVEWTEMAGFPCAGTWVGPQAVIDNVFKVLGSAWENYRFSLEHLVDGGDTIVGIGTYSGTYRATGKTMHARVTHVWRLDAGKVVKFEQFTDTLLVAKAMG